MIENKFLSTSPVPVFPPPATVYPFNNFHPESFQAQTKPKGGKVFVSAVFVVNEKR